MTSCLHSRSAAAKKYAAKAAKKLGELDLCDFSPPAGADEPFIAARFACLALATVWFYAITKGLAKALGLIGPPKKKGP